MDNQRINCKVESCKFQNSDKCTLKEILVGSMCNNTTKNKETICESFECNNKK